MANTASRLSANGSLTISGSFDEVSSTYVSSGLIGSWDANRSYYPEVDASIWYDTSGNNNIRIYNNNGTPALFSPSSNSANITFFTTNGSSVALGSYGLVTIPQLATTANVTIEGVFNIRQLVGMIGGFAGYDIYFAGGNFGFNTAGGDIFGISAATVTSLNLLNRNVHYVFVMPTSNLPGAYQLWINGVQQSISLVVGTGTATSRSYNSHDGTYTFQLNGWYRGTPINGTLPAGGTYYGNVSWSSFRMYNRVLTPTEIRQNYNIASARYQLGSTVNPVVTATVANNVTQNVIQTISGEFNEVDYNPNNIGPTKNLLQNSQDFNQRFAWLIANGTVTKNQALSPDNTQTATLFSATGQYPVIYYYPPGDFSGYKLVEPGKFYTHSMFVKYVNQSRCTLVNESSPVGGFMIFDLLTGTLAASINGSITRATITPFPNGWWRISVTYLIPSTSYATNPNEFYWQPQWRLGNYDGTNYNGSQMLVWGAQLEEGNTASTYVATGFPKNMLLFTDELTTLSTYYWYRENCTITKNATISPDGNYNGFLLSSTINGGSNTGFFQRQLSNLPINTNYTYSVYLKQGTSPTTFLNFYNVSPFSQLIATITWPAIYGNGPTVSYSGDATRLASTITDAGSGWWRFSLSMNNGSSSGLMWRVYVTTNGVTNVIGNSVYVWGPQLEFGLTPTTLIRNAGNFINTLPLANTNMVLKTTNTGNTFVKGTYDEYSKMSPITEGLIFNIDPGYEGSYIGSGSTMYDTTQNRYRVDLNNSPPYSSDFGGTLKFTSTFGNNAWANTNFPARTITPTSNYTMSAWIKLNRSNSGLAEFQFYTSSTGALVSPQANTGFAYGSIGCILGTNYYGDYGLFWSTRIQNSGAKELLMGFQNRVTPYQEASPQLTYPMNNSLIFFNWTHIVGVLNNAGNFAGFYVNGVLATSTTASQIASGSFPYAIPTIRICADNASGGSGFPRNFDGDIGPMSIWNRALSASEIQQMYNSQRSRFGV